jgi:hypothetical protein
MLSSTVVRWFLVKSVGWVYLQALEIMGPALNGRDGQTISGFSLQDFPDAAGSTGSFVIGLSVATSCGIARYVVPSTTSRAT